MKIRKIYIKNINSLAGEHWIDFTTQPLSDASLFLITGPTGAGKSTILDAICLALYDSCPRIESPTSTSINISGGIMTKGARETEAMVEFEQSGDFYKSRWTIQYNRNDNLNERKMELIKYNSDKDDWEILVAGVSGVKSMVAELIKLDYGQFTKTVLLSQGNFAKLLNANKADRYGLMEKITGEALYRKIGKKIYDEADKKEKLIEQEKELLKGIDLFSEDEKTAIQSQLESLRSAISNLTNSSKAFADKKEIKEKLIEKSDEVSAKNNELEILENSNQGLSTLMQKLEIYSKVKPLFILLDEILEIDKQLTANQQIKEKDQTVLNHAIKKFNDKKTVWSEILKMELSDENLIEQISVKAKQVQDKQTEFVAKQNISNKADEEQAHAQKTVVEWSEKLERAQQKLQDNEKNKNKLSADAQAYANLLASFSNLDDWNQALNWCTRLQEQMMKNESAEASSNSLKTYYSEKQNALRIEIQDIESSIQEDKLNEWKNRVKAEIESVVKYIDDLSIIQKLSEELETKTNEEATINKALGELEDTIGKKTEAKERQTSSGNVSKKKLEWAEAVIEFEKWKTHLVDGEACPLCGSTEHPGVSAADYELIKEKAAADEALIKNLEKELLSLTTQLGEKNEALKSCKNRIEEIKRDKENHIKMVSDYLLMDAEAFNQDLALGALEHKKGGFEIEMKACIEKENLLNSLPTKRNDLGVIETKLSTINEFETEWEKLMAKVKSGHSNIASLTEYLKEVNEKKSAYDQIQESIKKLNTEEELERNNITNADDQLKTAKAALEKRSKDCSEALQQLNEVKEALAALPTIADPMDVLTNEIKILTEIQQEIAHQQGQIKESDQQIQELSDQKNPTERSLLESMKQAGYETIDSLNLVRISADDETKILTQQASYSAAKTSLRSTIDAVTEEINELVSKDDPQTTMIEIDDEIKNIEDQKEKLNQEIGGWNEKLDADAKANQEHAEKIKKITELEKEALPFILLRKKIGDSNGNKFNELAQEITLRKLIQAANANLAMIQPRYELDMHQPEYGEKEENLYVIDKTMGDSRRAANQTLSGGETFAVSLALAIGLSDLAAGKAELGNLFIDEGFGSLDPDTLEGAIGMLEELQQQRGRTIGIISHMAEVKERISTQIKIEKKAGGFSTIKTSF